MNEMSEIEDALFTEDELAELMPAGREDGPVTDPQSEGETEVPQDERQDLPEEAETEEEGVPETDPEAEPKAKSKAKEDEEEDEPLGTEEDYADLEEVGRMAGELLRAKQAPAPQVQATAPAQPEPQRQIGGFELTPEQYEELFSGPDGANQVLTQLRNSIREEVAMNEAEARRAEISETVDVRMFTHEWLEQPENRFLKKNPNARDLWAMNIVREEEKEGGLSPRAYFERARSAVVEEIKKARSKRRDAESDDRRPKFAKASGSRKKAEPKTEFEKDFEQLAKARGSSW